MKKVIIDVDAGIDDIYAILLLLFGKGTENVEILGITCVRGNTPVENVYGNVERILELVNKEIPVYIGENEPIITEPQFYKPAYFGKDGFGDKCKPFEPKILPPKISAHEFINESIKKYPKEITLICSGPLTNIALALKMHSALSENLREIIIMGGNYNIGGDTNDANDEAEFNFRCDVEAVNIVLKKSRCPIKILPKETCEMSKIPIEWRLTTLGKINNKVMDLMNLVELQYVNGQESYITYDPFLTAAILNPDIITGEIDAKIRIELFNPNTRGCLFDDKKDKGKNVIKIISKINTELFESILYNTINNIELQEN